MIYILNHPAEKSGMDQKKIIVNNAHNNIKSTFLKMWKSACMQHWDRNNSSLTRMSQLIEKFDCIIIIFIEQFGILSLQSFLFSTRGKGGSRFRVQEMADVEIQLSAYIHNLISSKYLKKIIFTKKLRQKKIQTFLCIFLFSKIF